MLILHAFFFRPYIPQTPTSPDILNCLYFKIFRDQGNVKRNNIPSVFVIPEYLTFVHTHYLQFFVE